MTADYIIIKYYESFRVKLPGIPDAFPQWGLVRPRLDSATRREVAELKPIPRAKAMQLIREDGLVEVHRDQDGTVYDKPNKEFWRRHAGIRIPKEL